MSDFVEHLIGNIRGLPGRGILSTVVTYQSGTSATTAPTGTWSTSIPSVGAGNYLWTRTVITYSDNTTSTSYSVARQGIDGGGNIQSVIAGAANERLLYPMVSTVEGVVTITMQSAQSKQISFVPIGASILVNAYRRDIYKTCNPILNTIPGSRITYYRTAYSSEGMASYAGACNGIYSYWARNDFEIINASQSLAGSFVQEGVFESSWLRDATWGMPVDIACFRGGWDIIILRRIE